MDYIISVENLTKKFGEKIAVDNISFNVKKGAIFGFLGTNGAGKSTTIKMLTGLLIPSAGNIKVSNCNPVKEEKKLCSKIGVVPEQMNLYEDLTVKENLIIFSRLYNVNIERVNSVIIDLELTNYSKYKIKKLSKGYKQRVLIARALLHSPEIIFLDEPTSGLDVNIAVEIRKLIKKLQSNGTTIFITTHYMHEAEELCDEIAIIKNGKIVANDSITGLKSKYGSNKIIVTTQSGIKEFDYKNINQLANISHEELKSIHSSEPSLEEIYLLLTKE
ncbi:ABC transporter ATP-binding protein [Clostridium sp. BJN0013]|uniref:ABC transporter ATP-binding protein n=1 Tax=Clostridium sp. BJN0013 TaxID=3236840 RepID=UPI0034C6DE3B